MEERQDLISRQVVIDALRDAENHAFNSFYKGLAKAHKIIADLPSVQPDHVADIGKKVSISCAHENDVVSRQAAIDALDIAIERYDEIAEKYRKKADIERNDYMDMRDNAYEAQQLAQWLNELKYLREKIEQITIKTEPKWIPVSERMPEYNESVLTWDGYVFCIEKRIPYIRDDDGEPIEGDWWVGDEYDDYESEYYPNLRDGAAIAWMPLPEPYRGGDE